MQQKRVFLGVFIDSNIFSNYFNKIKADFDKVSFGKWVEPNNLHFTMKFLGDVDVSAIPIIKSKLEDILTEKQSGFNITGLSVLPQRGLPRVLYAAIETKDLLLNESAILIDTLLEEEGFPSESRDFFPHITLLRMKSTSNDFRSVLRKYSQTEFGKVDSFKIDLIESKLSSSGPVYRII